MKSSIIISTLLLFALPLFFALPSCTQTVEVEVTKDGCVTISGIPSGITEVTLTLKGPKSGWTQKGPVKDGKWGPHCFPRSFVGQGLNKGSVLIDTRKGTADGDSYQNKGTIRLNKGDNEVGFNKFEKK